MSPLYLSQLILTTRRRDVQYDLSDCCALHRRVLQGFPDDAAITSARQHFGVLYRLEIGSERTCLLVQSQVEPDWSRLPTEYVRSPAAVKRVDGLYATLTEGRDLQFRLCANPTRRIGANNLSQGEHWRGKRVEIVREEDQIDWLRHKGQQNGFALLPVRTKGKVVDVATRSLATHRGRHQHNHTVTVKVVTFEGRLRITDHERFLNVLAQGVGSGKAYGAGLLSIAPC